MTDMSKQTEALREAQQPAPATELREQEPVAYLVDGDLYYPEEIDWETLQEQGHTVAALYTSPPAQEFVCSTGLCHYRKPLTDEEIWDEVKAADLDWQTGWSLDEDASNRYVTFARAIEAAHGIKGDA